MHPAAAYRGLVAVRAAAGGARGLVLPVGRMRLLELAQLAAPRLQAADGARLVVVDELRHGGSSSAADEAASGSMHHAPH